MTENARCLGIKNRVTFLFSWFSAAELAQACGKSAWAMPGAGRIQLPHRWIYWSSRFVKHTLVFTDDRLTDGRGIY